MTSILKLSGLRAVRYTVTWLENITATFLRSAPAAIKEAGVEALLIDQVSPEGGTIESYKINAVQLQQAIHNAGGVTCAANIIEKVIFTGKPTTNK